MPKTFVIPAAEGYKSLASSDQPADVTATISGLLGLDISQHYEDRLGTAQNLLQLGEVYARQGKANNAVNSLQRALKKFREIETEESSDQDPSYRHDLAETLLMLGRLLGRQSTQSSISDRSLLMQAYEHFREASTIFCELGDISQRAECLLGLCECEARKGDLTEAIVAGEGALSLFASIDDGRGQQRSRRLLMNCGKLVDLAAEEMQED